MFARFRRGQPAQDLTHASNLIKLPEPIHESDTAVERALLYRKSIRSYRHEPLELSDIAQLLWAAQGITRPGGYRTAPSAGALYPLEVYLLAGNVSDLKDGLYKYRPLTHELEQVLEVDKRTELSKAALNQESIQDAPAVIIICADYERTKGKYGERGEQYVHMEVGSAAQNVYLQAVSLDLGTVFIGAFYDEEVKKVLEIGGNEEPLCILPIGRP